MHNQGPERIADYFLVIGLDPDIVPLQDDFGEESGVRSLVDHESGGSASSPGSQPTGLDAVLRIRYKPKVIDRFPLTDYGDTALPPQVAMFAHPEGLTCKRVAPLPTYYTIVFTSNEGRRVYASVLTFHDVLPEDVLDRMAGTHVELQDNNKFWVPKCLCIVSHWPFHDAYKEFLKQLYRLSVSSSRIALERVICNFMQEVPLPPKGLIRVQYTIADKTVDIQRSPNNKLPAARVSMDVLFSLLDKSNVILLFTCVLLEQKILVFSSHISVLTVVTETLLTLIYPFKWDHVYVPVLPLQLLEFLNAPTPFIIGVHPGSLAHRREEFLRTPCPDDVVVVDLDKNVITMPSQSIPPLPEKQRKKLMEHLELYADVFDPTRQRLEMIDLAFPMAPTPEDSDKKVEGAKWNAQQLQYSFLRVFLSMLQRYRECLVMPSPEDPEPVKLFKKDKFLENSPKESRKFLSQFLDTSMFAIFVEHRLFDSGKDLAHVFFDEAIDAKSNRSALRFSKKPTPFLDDKLQAVTRTHVVIAPSDAGLTRSFYTYETFPRLSPELFCPPREIRSLVTGELRNNAQKPTGQAGTERLGALGRYMRYNGSRRSVSAKQAVNKQSALNMRESVYGTWFLLQMIVIGEGDREQARVHVDLVFKVIARMKDEKVLPDVGTYRAVLEVCGRAGQPERALHVLEEMQQRGLRPDALVYGSIMKAVASSPGEQLPAFQQSPNQRKSPLHAHDKDFAAATRERPMPTILLVDHDTQHEVNGPARQSPLSSEEAHSNDSAACSGAAHNATAPTDAHVGGAAQGDTNAHVPYVQEECVAQIEVAHASVGEVAAHDSAAQHGNLVHNDSGLAAGVHGYVGAHTTVARTSSLSSVDSGDGSAAYSNVGVLETIAGENPALSEGGFTHKEVSDEEVSHKEDIASKELLHEKSSSKQLARKVAANNDVADKEISHKDVADKEDADKEIALAHKDVAHKDVAHKDVAHKDVAHKDVAHKDVAHKDVAPQEVPQAKKLSTDSEANAGGPAMQDSRACDQTQGTVHGQDVSEGGGEGLGDVCVHAVGGAQAGDDAACVAALRGDAHDRVHETADPTSQDLVNNGNVMVIHNEGVHVNEDGASLKGQGDVNPCEHMMGQEGGDSLAKVEGVCDDNKGGQPQEGVVVVCDTRVQSAGVPTEMEGEGRDSKEEDEDSRTRELQRSVMSDVSIPASPFDLSREASVMIEMSISSDKQLRDDDRGLLSSNVIGSCTVYAEGEDSDAQILAQDDDKSSTTHDSPTKGAAGSGNIMQDHHTGGEGHASAGPNDSMVGAETARAGGDGVYVDESCREAVGAQAGQTLVLVQSAGGDVQDQGSRKIIDGEGDSDHVVSNSEDVVEIKGSITETGTGSSAESEQGGSPDRHAVHDSMQGGAQEAGKDTLSAHTHVQNSAESLACAAAMSSPPGKHIGRRLPDDDFVSDLIGVGMSDLDVTETCEGLTEVEVTEMCEGESSCMDGEASSVIMSDDASSIVGSRTRRSASSVSCGDEYASDDGEGDGNVAKGDGNAAKGDGNVAKGDGNVAKGDGNAAKGDGKRDGKRDGKGDGKVAGGESDVAISASTIIAKSADALESCVSVDAEDVAQAIVTLPGGITEAVIIVPAGMSEANAVRTPDLESTRPQAALVCDGTADQMMEGGAVRVSSNGGSDAHLSKAPSGATIQAQPAPAVSDAGPNESTHLEALDSSKAVEETLHQAVETMHEAADTSHKAATRIVRDARISELASRSGLNLSGGPAGVEYIDGASHSPRQPKSQPHSPTSLDHLSSLPSTVLAEPRRGRPPIPPTTPPSSPERPLAMASGPKNLQGISPNKVPPPPPPRRPPDQAGSQPSARMQLAKDAAYKGAARGGDPPSPRLDVSGHSHSSSVRAPSPAVPEAENRPQVELWIEDTCPDCNRALDEADIRRGWQPDEQQYTTQCPHCARRFVARFTVHFEPSSYTDSPKLHCECLSPLVVRKEVSNLLRGTDAESDGSGGWDPESSVSSFVQYLRIKQPAIFWNIVWHFISCQLPLSFMLVKEHACIHKRRTPEAGKPSPRRMLSSMVELFSASSSSRNLAEHTSVPDR